MNERPAQTSARPLLLLVGRAETSSDEAASAALEILRTSGFHLESTPADPFPTEALTRAALVAVPLAGRDDPAFAPILAEAALRNLPLIWIGGADGDGQGERVRALEARLASAWRAEALGRLVSGVAHDFNNVLSVVTTLTELILRFGPADNPDREDLEEVHAAARRGSELTRQLLAFGRSDPGEPRPLDLNERVSAVRKLLGKLLPEDIELRAELAEGLPPIHADPAEIDQILLELVAWARYRLTHGGTVRLRTGEGEGSVSLESTLEPRVGAPGQASPADGDPSGASGDASRAAGRDALPGAGASRASADASPASEDAMPTEDRSAEDAILEHLRPVVARRGGRLSVVTERPGVETIRIELPGVRSEAVEDGAPDDQVPAGGGRRVLVVEDDGPVRRATCRALEALGFATATAGSIDEARRTLAAAPADAVLCDAVLPDGWGAELWRSLGGREGRIPFVFVSGHEGHPALAEIDGAEAALLRKPLSGLALARALEAALSGR